MKIGFTGTRRGMTALQRAFVYRTIGACHTTEVHHGACIGADETFHHIALLFKIPVVVHPGVNRQGKCFSRANCPQAKEVRPEKFFLDRDKDIVNSVDFLIATPREHKEQLRSGTWATIRYAKKKNKDMIIIFPDGSYDVR